MMGGHDVALLDGQDIFGDAVTTENVFVPRRAQRNEYPGLEWVEELDQGGTIHFTTVTGRVYGDSPSGVGAWLLTLRSFDDGLTHVLVDNDGVTWPAAKFDALAPQGRGVQAGPYGYTRRYVMRFRHLQPPTQ